jgi:hypothetical protein
MAGAGGDDGRQHLASLGRGDVRFGDFERLLCAQAAARERIVAFPF